MDHIICKAYMYIVNQCSFIYCSLACGVFGDLGPEMPLYIVSLSRFYYCWACFLIKNYLKVKASVRICFMFVGQASCEVFNLFVDTFCIFAFLLECKESGYAWLCVKYVFGFEMSTQPHRVSLGAQSYR